MRVAAIITVKRFASAKQRLSGGLGPGTRRALAEAMFFDVLGSVRRCKAFERVMVVTGEPVATEISISYGIEVVEDERDLGQSEAAALGIRRAVSMGAEAVALIPGDCPLLDAQQLDALIARVAANTVAVVPDRHGTGTNGLVLSPPNVIQPAFGEGSRERHERLAAEAGATVIVEEIPSLAIDLDTAEDLTALQEALTAREGTAPRTDGTLRQMRLAGPRPAGAEATERID